MITKIIILIMGIIVIIFLANSLYDSQKGLEICSDEKYDEWIYFQDRNFPPECILINEEDITWRSKWDEVVNDSCIEGNEDYNKLSYHCVWGNPAWLGMVSRIMGITMILLIIYTTFAPENVLKEKE